MKTKLKIILGFALILLLGCSQQYYIEDCIIGNRSMRQEFIVAHPELTSEEFELAWSL